MLQRFLLTPGECNAEHRLSVGGLVNRLVEVATIHAEQIGVGFSKLEPLGKTWVLSRVALEMKRWPEDGETYHIDTWVVSINRLFSERAFEIRDAAGNVIGHALTVWAVISMSTRKICDLADVQALADVASDRVCPIAPPSRLKPIADGSVSDYTFRFCDLDFNRHVNSAKYIELLLNQWDLDFHDTFRIIRFEIAYLREAHYGDAVKVAADIRGLTAEAEITLDGAPICRAAFTFEPRPEKITI